MRIVIALGGLFLTSWDVASANDAQPVMIVVQHTQKTSVKVLEGQNPSPDIKEVPAETNTFRPHGSKRDTAKHSMIIRKKR